MGKSNISYLDYVWNPVTGCSGKNCQAQCYAREMVKRFPAIHGWYKDMEPIPFNQAVFHEDRLTEPLHWRKPRVVGVCFFGDLFDEQVEYDWLDQIWEVFGKAQHHVFVILTKQPQIMENYIGCRQHFNMPLHDNVWHGTTVTTQAEADERIPELLKVPGKKWLSIEPLLSAVNIEPYLRCEKCGYSKADQLFHWDHQLCKGKIPEIECVIVGGESGPKARPMHPDWVRSIRDQCAAAGVPFYFKQWGEWSQSKWPSYSIFDKARAGKFQTSHIVSSSDRRENGKTVVYPIPTDYDGSVTGIGKMERIGLKAAGRTLDGRIHDELPWRKA